MGSLSYGVLGILKILIFVKQFISENHSRHVSLISIKYELLLRKTPDNFTRKSERNQLQERALVLTFKDLLCLEFATFLWEVVRFWVPSYSLFRYFALQSTVSERFKIPHNYLYN